MFRHRYWLGALLMVCSSWGSEVNADDLTSITARSSLAEGSDTNMTNTAIFNDKHPIWYTSQEDSSRCDAKLVKDEPTGGDAFSISTVIVIHYIHGGIMLFLWGIVSNLSIMVARYHKTYYNYAKLHGNIMIALAILTFISEFLLIWLDIVMVDQKKDRREIVHLVYAILIMIIILVQVFLGYVSRLKLSKPTIFPQIRSFTKAHKILGYCLFIFINTQMMVGCFIFGNLLVMIMVGTLAPILALWVLKERRYRKEQTRQIRVNSVPVGLLSIEQERLVSLLNALFNSDLTLDAESIRNTMNDPKYGVEHIDWVLLDNKIYDISNLTHPGGKFIIKAVKGREIGRFFYGDYGLELFDDKYHTHSTSASLLLQSMCIGDLVTQSKLIVPYMSELGESILSDESRYYLSEEDFKRSTQPLHEHMLPKVEQSMYYWTLRFRDELDRNVIKFSFESFSKYKINQSYQSLAQFGKHFKICHASNTKARLYTTLLCHTPQNIKLREEFIEYLNKLAHGDSKFTFRTHWQLYSSTIPFIVKKYDLSGAFSKFLHENTYVGKDEFSITGPFGFGLELYKELKGHYIIFCAGTGILPFLDLFDLLLRKLIYDIVSEKLGPYYARPLEPYISQFLDVVHPTFKITLYASFTKEDDFQAKEIIIPLADISSTYNQCLFSPFIGVGKGSLINNVLHNNVSYNKDFIANHLDMNAERVYICGPPKFNCDIPRIIKETGFDQSKVFLI